jgi:hypothetical protein
MELYQRKAPVVATNAGHQSHLPIDVHYDKWSRFENFLKFAERKELKDRLKELDPPPMSNYVDPSTIESIAKARKKPPLAGLKQTKKDPSNEGGGEHKKRINQMRELYGLFVKMEKETKEIDQIKESPDQVAKTIAKTSAKAADLVDTGSDL